MNFEIINDKNKVVMHTTDTTCIPDKDVLNLMLKAGYKFKLNGKATTIKKLNEQLKEIDDGEDNRSKDNQNQIS
jgi:histidinol phosphatase-like PHP family hydrolase